MPTILPLPARHLGRSLPPALALMAPFDLLASLAMDVYRGGPAALRTTPTVVQLTSASTC